METDWSDRKKWGMGILAALIVAGFSILITSLLKNSDFNPEIKPYKGGIILLQIPPQNAGSNLIIEAVHEPKSRRNFRPRYYDVFLKNISDNPITIISVVVDTWFKGKWSQLTSSDGIALYPDVSYEFKYHPNMLNQVMPLNKPFVVKGKGVAALRLRFGAGNYEYKYLDGSVQFNARFKDSDGNDYYFITSSEMPP